MVLDFSDWLKYKVSYPNKLPPSYEFYLHLFQLAIKKSMNDSSYIKIFDEIKTIDYDGYIDTTFEKSIDRWVNVLGISTLEEKMIIEIEEILILYNSI